MKKKQKKWYKLDNAAKIFPPTSSKNDSKVFRFACELYEDIDEEVLQEALNKTLEEYPLFLSSLKKGLFWYYLETSSIMPVVTKEKQRICEQMPYDLLFRVTYYKKRINLEVHHALSDGTGTLNFLKSLISNYLIKKHKIKNKIIIDNTSIYEKEVDSYKKYYKVSKGTKTKSIKKAYNLGGNRYPEQRIKIIEGIVPTKDILKISKEFKTTVTVYLTSILIKSIALTMNSREKKKPIVITIPVNLRKYFKSNTARNFFNTVFISYSVNDNDTIDEIIKIVDTQLKENLKKENLSYKINSYSILENIFLIRLVPVFIKDLVLKLFHYKSNKEQTIALSNIGIIDMPEELQKYIKLFDVFNSTHSMHICMCSYLDNMTLSFSSHFINTEIQKNFFRELSEKGIDITINDNVVEDTEYEEML